VPEGVDAVFRVHPDDWTLPDPDADAERTGEGLAAAVRRNGIPPRGVPEQRRRRAAWPAGRSPTCVPRCDPHDDDRLSANGRGPRIQPVVRLHEFYQDAHAPQAHDILPAAFAAVRNAVGEVLLVRRIDDGYWELPGGRIEVGETAREAVIREVAEESGISIELTTLSGVYSDPSHVLVDPDGSIHQQLALCFHAVPAAAGGDAPRADGIEIDGASWCDPTALTDLAMHPAMRLRLHNAVTAPDRTHYD
jgi:8-oxo-dGTP pyrophosphatase MutT (NUDIX family)